ncbi:MAG: LysM peptidoglycan-binding domain-containing protein [Acidobacteriota bacterium]
MSGRGLILALAATLFAACRTASPPPAIAQDSTKNVTGASAGESPCEAARDEAESLLDAAQEAAAGGAIGDLAACEDSIIAALSRCFPAASADPELAAYLDGILEDLDRLGEQALAAGAGQGERDTDEGVPPEPQPVPPERVATEQERAREASFDLPVVVNAEVTSLIDFYSSRYRERFIVALGRAGRYLPAIRAELARAGLPLDLAYLPFVESAFNPRARSRARAQGLWQFVSGTARLYDLHCDGLVDERNDPYLATRAAVAHLADLRAMFGDWELALAAYNSGPGRVQRALRRARSATDFWQIRRFLPRETRNYVPAMWAVLVLVKNLSRYELPAIVESSECLGRVAVNGALDLEVLAERASLSLDQLSDLNPALTHRLTPARSSYQLAVPCGDEERVAVAIAAIPAGERIRHHLHVVRRGDTLGAIARAYGSTVDAITAANRVSNPRSLRIGQTLVVPRHPSVVRLASAFTGGRQPSRVASAAPKSPPASYRVRRGDTLFDIARRYGVSVEQLKQRNRLRGNLIHPGDLLALAP